MPNGKFKAALTTTGQAVKIQSSGAAKKAKSFTLPVAVIAGFLPMAIPAAKALKAGNYELAAATISIRTTGIDPRDRTWHPGEWMKEGLLPIAAGIMVHKYIGQKMGVNRMLARAGVPVLRL